MLVKERMVMKKPQVSIAKGDNAKQLTMQVLRDIQASKVVAPSDKILLKPNYVTAAHPSTGVTTSSEVMEAIIQFLKDHGLLDITIGEGGVPGSTERAFDVVGIREIAKRHQLKLVNLNKDNMVKVKIPNAMALKEVHIARTVLDATCLISVPKLKVHHMAYITCGMKNMMGAIWPKSIMHGKIHQKIVDLTSILTPRLTVVDGLIGSEKNETSGNPVKMDLIIAGTDMVAVDAVCASVMGIDPKDIQYLQLATTHGLGTADLNAITILGEQIPNVRHVFELPKELRI
ncbi:MAG: DUF362 domain-containing protein [Candidatus Heimdallarchaeota archaeon]